MNYFTHCYINDNELTKLPTLTWTNIMKKIHIGKFEPGWDFVFQSYRQIRSWQDWQQFILLSNQTIYDSFDNEISFNTFCKIVVFSKLPYRVGIVLPNVSLFLHPGNKHDYIQKNLPDIYDELNMWKDKDGFTFFNGDFN